MNTRINFRYTDNYDEAIPNNNFPEELDSIITDGVYSFEDWLMDHDVKFKEDSDCKGFYWVTEDGKRTGEAYFIHSEEPTDEDLRG
ncbi:MAG: hypothetical protein J5994_10810 [Ruminococcus sp.]|nr:hypothetical protein [Ruminococcus sp.]